MADPSATPPGGEGASPADDSRPRSWGVAPTQRISEATLKAPPEPLAATVHAPAHEPPRADLPPSAQDTLGTSRAAASAPGETPRTVGRYLVISRLGEGGMGVVYAAYDPKLDRKVAVKLVRPGPGGSSASDDPKRRLEREARSLAKLEHVNVVKVYEVGSFEDQVFVAMEFVDGVTLREWQFKHAQSWRELLPKYIAAGRGLAAAHRAGIIHRDFKPDNALVKANGEVRVLDFGLAARRGRARAPGSPASIEALAALEISGEEKTVHAPADRTYVTQAGALVGTPAYMSPEQYTGGSVDATSDQFSFCVALYEALYGQRPFIGETLATLASNVVEGALAEPPAFVKVPQWLRRVLLRGLSTDPRLRYPDMDALLAALDHDPRVLLRYALAVVAGLALIAAAYFAWQSLDRERALSDQGARLRAEFDQARVHAAEAELQSLRARSLHDRWDDLVLAHAREQLERRPEDALAAIKHLTPASRRALPAARALAGDALRRGIPARRVKLELDGPARALAFTPSGELLALTGSNGQVELLRLKGEPARAPGPRASTRLHALALAEDDERAPLTANAGADPTLAASPLPGEPRVLAGAGDDGVVYLWSLATGATRALEGHDGPVRALAFSPDGRQLASAGDDGVVRLWSAQDWTDRALRDHSAPVRALAFSPDGELLASAGDDARVLLWSLSRPTHVALSEHRKPVERLVFATDTLLLSRDRSGHVIEWDTEARRGLELHARVGTRALHLASQRRVWLTQADGAPRLEFHERDASRPLLGDPAPPTAMGISPDARWAAIATPAGELELWSAGPNTAELLPDPDISIERLAFSPTGDSLATSNLAGALTLWTLSDHGKEALAPGGPRHAQLEFSPDGRWLAALTEAHELDVWPLDQVHDISARRRWLPEAKRFASGPFAWAPDSESVALDLCESHCVIARVFADERPSVTLPRPSLGPTSTLLFSPDGRRLAGDGERDDSPFVWDFDEARALEARWSADFYTKARRLALVFVDGGEQLRIATTHDEDVGLTLRVWHWNLETGTTLLLFEERALKHAGASRGAPTLLLRTHDLRNLLWSLDDDRLHVLPTIEGALVDFLTDPDRSHVLVHARSPDARRVDIHRLLRLDTGDERDLHDLHEPIAFSPDHSLADTLPHAGVRLWRDAGPDDPEAFQRWLARVTTRVVDRASIP